jgi:hypothetical protein
MPATHSHECLCHVTLIALLLLAPAAGLAQNVTREGNRWVTTVTGTAPAAARLRVNSQGPVHIEGGSGREVSYTARMSVSAGSAEEARRIFDQYRIRVTSSGGQVLFLAPGGAVNVQLTVKTPRLSMAGITTSDGDVEANGIEGALEVNSAAGALKCDRIRGNCNLATGGGDIQVGEVGGDLRCATAGGRITVKNAGGDAVLQTGGGDVEVGNTGGALRAETAGGAIRVTNAGGSVSATTGGGDIHVGKAGGTVTARNVAGPIDIGAAAAVRCESGSGRVQVGNITGPIHISTTVGSIVASLMGGMPFRESILETGNGDITVTIPSNLGVNVQAEAQRRIISDFPGLVVRMRGPQTVAEGPVNGGGPVLRISGMGGTVFIRRQ